MLVRPTTLVAVYYETPQKRAATRALLRRQAGRIGMRWVGEGRDQAKEQLVRESSD